MIAQLTGQVVDASASRIVLSVGGIGFDIGVSTQTASQFGVRDETITLLTRLIVREDAMELYGFASADEREVFDKLIAISGVGPKLALAILSTFSPAELAGVVLAQDSARLALAPGVGKKKAQRLLVELEGVFTKDEHLRTLTNTQQLAAAAPVALPAAQEAETALLSMGFTPQEATLALEGYQQEGAGTVEEILSYALRALGGSR